MSQNGECADENMVAATAHCLKQNILVISGIPNVAPQHAAVTYGGNSNPFRAALRLGHIFERHYESLIPVNGTTTHQLFQAFLQSYN